MNAINDSAERYADDARAEIAQLREKVETLMQTRVTPALSALAGEAEAAAHAASDSVKAQATRLSDTIKAQPLTALGIAALAGFVIAALVRR